MLEPGTFGGQFNHWRPKHRTAHGMTSWIEGFSAKKISPINAVLPVAAAAVNQNLPSDNPVLGAPKFEEEKRFVDSLE